MNNIECLNCFWYGSVEELKYNVDEDETAPIKKNNMS